MAGFFNASRNTAQQAARKRTSDSEAAIFMRMMGKINSVLSSIINREALHEQ